MIHARTESITTSTYERRFDSWTDALEAAGLDILLALKREDSSGEGFYRPTEATCGFVRTSLGLS